jgi:hypothetical protein
MNTEKPTAHPGGVGHTGVERRRYPRIEILGRIQSRVLSLNLPIAVLDMSLGGVCIQTDITFPIGELHEFRLTANEGEPLVISARVVHSLHASRSDGTPCYFIGFEFVEDDAPGTRLAVEKLMSNLRTLSDAWEADLHRCVDGWPNHSRSIPIPG